MPLPAPFLKKLRYTAECGRRPTKRVWGGLQGWAAALLMLDTGADLSDASDRTRLSTLGSAVLACVLRMPKARLEGFRVRV